MDRMKDLDQETLGIMLKVVGGSALIGTVGYGLYSLYRSHRKKVLIKNRQTELSKKKNNLMKKLEDLKTPFENMDEITNLNLNDLMNSMLNGTYTPLEVLQAYQAKALLMDKELNFITDINPYAEEDLLELDKLKKAHLKGIPVSIKDCFFINGCTSTYGMLDRCLTSVTNDDIMVRTLRLQGMIPFVLTNMCQSGMSIESSNPIFGETVNLYDKTRTSGGSSGGEAAIIASGASIIGMGSDIGGSIRIPSSYCGIFGLKPTANRFSHRHSHRIYSDQNIVNASIGPMARRIDDLITFFRHIACSDLYHLDPYCPPLCFNEKIFDKKRPLRIGYYTQLGGSQVTSVPAVVRAVNIAKSALEEKGHDVFEFSIPDIDYAVFNLYFRCLFTDGGKGFFNQFLSDNPVDPSIVYTVRLLRMPSFLKWFASIMILPFNKNYGTVLSGLNGVSSVHELWKLKDRVSDYQELVLSAWQAKKLDGIICPVLPIVAPPLGTSANIFDIIGYTAIYNLLNYPAGSVPVTRVNQDDVDEMIKSYPRNTSTHRKVIDYQKDSVGMPVGVQCVSILWREEICLRIMKDISDNIS